MRGACPPLPERGIHEPFSIKAISLRGYCRYTSPGLFRPSSQSLSDRAAQFAPFAALTSYHDAVREAARFTDDRIEPDEDVKDLLDERLRQLQQNADRHPRITILYFLPDEKKAGGTYVSATGSLKKIDWYQRLILLQDRTSVPIENIIELSFLS